MSRLSTVEVRFPLGGLNRRYAHRLQPPLTTPECLNVRPFGPIEGRQRGGSRPGLGKAYYTQLGDGNHSVNMLVDVDILTEDVLEEWIDTFDGTQLSDVWSVASWIGNLPAVLKPGASAATYNEEVGAVRDAFSQFDETEPYEIAIFCVPYKGQFGGEYRIYCRMDDNNPDCSQDGVEANLVLTGTSGNYSGTLKVYVGGSATTYNFASGTDGYPIAGWFRVLVSGDNIKAFWLGHELIDQNVSSAAGKRMGFGLRCTVAGGAVCIDAFRVRYRKTGVQQKKPRSVLVAACNKKIYYTDKFDQFQELSSSVNVSRAHTLQAAQFRGKLFIADYWERIEGSDGNISSDGTQLTATGVSDWTQYGIDTNSDVVVITNGTGNVQNGTYKIASVSASAVTLASSAGGAGSCSYYIGRAPKVFDPAVPSLSIWEADEGKGQVPTGCPLIALWRERLVLAGNPEYAWYMSRQADPYDWDYSQPAGDAQRAVAGSFVEAGNVERAITAVIPWSDDYLIFATATTIDLMAGDPARGGEIVNVSREVGIIDRFAWCRGPENTLIFLSRAGLCLMYPGALRPPQIVSRESIPSELRDIDPKSYWISLIYDDVGGGVHVYVVPKGD